MKLHELKIKARTEIPYLVNKYVNSISVGRGFREIIVPSNLIDEIEKQCDVMGIPCYRVTNNLLSTHDTYTELFNMEYCR